MIDAKNHLVTIIYSPNYEDINGQIIYGDDDSYNHAEAIDKIEKRMAQKFDWPQISFNERLSQEKVFMHNKRKNIVIENAGSYGEDAKLWIFLPEEIDDDKKELIKTFIEENRQYIIYLSALTNEEFVELNIDDFLHNKTLHFTNNVQNN